MTAVLDGAALDRLQADLDLANALENVALMATVPSGSPEVQRLARAALDALLPDVPGSMFGGFATPAQLAAARAVVAGFPMPTVGPDLVEVPVLRAVLRQWASAEWRRAQVLAA